MDFWNRLPMEWLEALNLFANGSEEVRIPDEGPLPHIPSWLRLLTFEEIEQADDAARHFAEHWQWPDRPCMNRPNVRYALYFRCLFAMEIVQQANAAGMPPPPGYDQALLAKPLAHILVELWDRQGLEWADIVFPGCEPGGSPDPGRLE
jgi:hypothetical protein